MIVVKVANIRRPVEEPESRLLAHLARELHVDADDVIRWRIFRKSLDARSKRHLMFVYSVIVELPEDPAVRKLIAQTGNLAEYRPEPFDDPQPGPRPLEHPPVVVGSGPAGLLAGYYLASRGYHPIILERGQPVKGRVPAIRAFDAGREFDGENNYLFGEGGAGCFSDGKLTCRMSGADVEWVMDRFVECGSRPSIRFEHRPHLGSNKLPLICRNFRRKIEELGGEYRFGCRLEGVTVQAGRLTGVSTSGGPIPTSQVILAIGHSARDTYQMLFETGIPMEQKAFQLGLRIEQPQENVNRWKYGKPEYLDMLGAADYTLTARGTKDLYTFCMCAGGVVIPSVSEPGRFCTNGMSNSRHDTPFANSGLVVTLEPDEFGNRHPLAGVEIQRKYEEAAFTLAGSNYRCPIQSAADFLQQRVPAPQSHYASSYPRGIAPMDLSPLLPPVILRTLLAGLPIMDHKWKGKFLRDAMLVGPEMRGSSPVRLLRDSITLQSPGIEGLYPSGEGAGFAGGIISAAVDGLRCARKVVEHFSPILPD